MRARFTIVRQHKNQRGSAVNLAEHVRAIQVHCVRHRRHGVYTARRGGNLLASNLMHRSGLSALVLCFVATSIADANNNFFLPGDAFFPTQLTAEDVRALQEGKPEDKVFLYSSFGGYSGAFCGYAGYLRTRIATVDRPFIKNLSLAYDRVRAGELKKLVEVVRDGKTKLEETNGMRVLFYPQAFDFKRFHLGLQYNEKWADEAVKFGHKREHLRLCELIDDKDAVAQSWRDATAVGTFEASFPKLELRESGPLEEPMTINGPVQAIILRHYSLKEYFQRKELVELFAVDSKGITYYFWNGSKHEWATLDLEE
jgi:hypothetical protein